MCDGNTFVVTEFIRDLNKVTVPYNEKCPDPSKLVKKVVFIRRSKASHYSLVFNNFSAL